MKTMFLAWQDHGATRLWYPIGRLDADLEKSSFQFGYTLGAKQASQKAGLKPLDAFPDFTEVFRSNELFPLFKNRIVGVDRQDFQDYLRQLDLSPEEADPLEILALTGGERETDNLEVFPRIKRHGDGSFRCRFFLHGWRHVNEAAQNRLKSLKSGESLQVAIELTNPVTTLAIQLQTPEEYHMIGWAPRYLVNDLCAVIGKDFNQLKARIVRINPSPAPAKQRILIELTGRWPQGYDPMSTSDFTLITAA
jgi:hypothetical protein